MRRFVDAGERVEADQPIKGEAALPPEFDELRDEDIGNAVALDDTAHRAAEEHRIHVQLEFRAERRDADDAAYAGEPKTVDRLTHDLRNTGTLERVLNALAPRQRLN